MFSSTCHRWKWDEVFDMLFTRSFKSKLLKHTSIKIWEGQSCSFCCSKSCTVHRPCPEKGIFTVYLWIIQTLRLNFVPGLLCYITSELRYFRETACVVFACSSSVHTECACLVSIVIFRDVCKQLIGTDKGNVVCMWHDVWKRWWRFIFADCTQTQISAHLLQVPGLLVIWLLDLISNWLTS